MVRSVYDLQVTLDGFTFTGSGKHHTNFNCFKLLHVKRLDCFEELSQLTLNSCWVSQLIEDSYLVLLMLYSYID